MRCTHGAAASAALPMPMLRRALMSMAQDAALLHVRVRGGTCHCCAAPFMFARDRTRACCRGAPLLSCITAVHRRLATRWLGCRRQLRLAGARASP